MMEVVMDQMADELGMDRLELRRKNFIAADSFPHETALGHRLRLGQLRRGARPAHGEARPRGARAREGGARPPRASGAASATRPTRRSAGWRPRGYRARGFGLQTGLWESAMSGARHRCGHGLHGDLAARPGPRHDLRRSSPTARRRPEHRVSTATGHGREGLGTTGRGRSAGRRHGAQATGGRDEGAAIVAHARGRARGHRVADGKFSSRARPTRA
jgi:carbon-monoxide dehydrogenase large subunit